jgi:hypothetical protein
MQPLFELRKRILVRRGFTEFSAFIAFAKVSNRWHAEV